MLRKYATATIIGAEIAERNALGLVKAAHRAVFNYEPKPGFLYVRSRMISSRCNDNHDEFPAEEIKAAWKTALGKPAFVNHHNEDHRRMRGVIIDAALHEDTLPTGEPDTWIEALHEIDAVRFPKLAQAILSGRVNRTSMGCDVGFSVCSACGNKASTPAEYCQHIPAMKGRVFYRHTASGNREGQIIREICHKLSFFENSFLVEDPADPTAVVTGIDDRGLKATAKKDPRFEGVGLKQDNDGWYVQTHRARSDSYETPEDIPDSDVKFIRSTGSLHKEAISGGMRYHFTPAGTDRAVDHKVEALVPNEAGHLEPAGHLAWHGHHGMVSMVRTEDKYRGQGIATALWEKAHEIAAKRGLTPPRHSDVKTPKGMGWAKSVDERGLSNMPGEGQQDLFPEPEGHELMEGPHVPRGDTLREHLGLDHGYLTSHPRFQRLSDAEVEAEHDKKHRHENQYTRPPWIHTHGSKRAVTGVDDWGLRSTTNRKEASLRKFAEHWVECDQGHEHWGPHGAAGMLIRHHDPDDGETRYLLQRRAPWVDHGGTWGIPGGAMEHDEEPMEAAHRESEEEMGDLPHDLEHHKTYTDDHGGWAYHTVVMNTPHQFAPEGGEDDESRGHGWFTREEMERMSLHPGFAHTLHKVAMRKGAPFAGYEDFEECEERNADKEDPSAYCGEIKHRVEGRLRTLADLSDEDIQKGLGLPTAEQGHQDVVKEKGKALAEGLMAPFYEPYGGYEGYQLHQQNEGMMDLHRRYEGGSGKFGFDEDSDPYYQVHHKTPEGRLSGWSIKHYSDGPNATIHHEATGPEEAHELFDIGEDTYSPDKGGLGRHVQPPSRFGHKELEDTLKHWVEGPEEETGGARDYLEKNDPRIKRWKQRYPQGKLPPRQSSLPSVTAYGETKAPADVDTLRDESCPVCGEGDSFDGNRCEVCHFVQPPSMFTDPDTSVARQMDLKNDQFDQGKVGPNGEPLPDVDDQQALQQNTELGMPGQPGDQVADLFCPACGFSADTQEPMTNNDPSAPPENAGLMEGDLCPNCEQATMLSPNDVGELGGEVPQEMADDADADSVPDDEEADANGDGIPDDADLDQDGVPDLAEQDADGDGVPDSDEGSEDPDADRDEDQEAESDDSGDGNPVEDDEEALKGRKDNSRRAARRGSGEDHMSKQPNKAATGASSKLAALEKKVAEQDRILRVQAHVIEIAGQQLHYLATLAGVGKEFEAIKREGVKKMADVLNPAQPIPDPASGGPTETTEQAEAPQTFDDPRNPGITPGSTQGVPAQQVDTPLAPGETLPTSPFTNLTDVTQPVAGTETHVPLNQTKIETDVRVGDPMVNADNPQGYGFPLTGPFAADGAASANSTTSPGMQRTMASLRLAKLRKSAGLLQGDADELMVATEIERTAGLTDQMIEHEITTLDALATRQAARTPGRRPAGGPLPRTASSQRRVPSLATAGENLAPVTAGAGAGFAADDASDIFLA